jgi:ABC-type uncharacterized transport system substrate-binding protein
LDFEIPRSTSQKPYSIAVVLSGDYLYYRPVFLSIYKGLAELGWVGATELHYRSIKELQALPQIGEMIAKFQVGQSAVIFPQELFLDLNWQDNSWQLPEFQRIVSGASGADAVICLGTMAAEACITYAQQSTLAIPVLIESVSDPLQAGISSFFDSGYDFITASCDPDNVRRQIKLFHTLIQFKTLGVIHSTSSEGMAYSGIDDIQALGNELGFKVISYTDVIDDSPDPAGIAKAEMAYLQGVEYLSTRTDALYLAIQTGLTSRSVPKLVQICINAKLPTFAAEGALLVEQGVLLGESSLILDDEGLYSARKLIRILKGALPRSLPQVAPYTAQISLNMHTARSIGVKFPMETLLQADLIFGTRVHNGFD